jgi:threonylcarbamoyladenosine tRNA methylthiotransferase MtaB
MTHCQQPRVAFHTLGCKLNQAETDGLRRGFEERGYTVVDSWTEADVCLLNTCSVTERADSKCRQALRKAVRAAPQATVIVTGCYAQVEADALLNIPGVDMVLGAGEKFRVFELLDQWDGKPLLRRSNHESQFELEDSFGASIERTRAFVKIQDGCGFDCAYCIIPTTRGDSRSRSSQAVLTQVAQLVRGGFQEIVLTGVNLIQYRDPQVRNLTGLLHAMRDVIGSARIRLGSVEPNGINRRLLDEIADNPSVCRHLHIPLQSGDAGILENMERRYTPEKYREVVEQAAKMIPGLGIGVDVMVGYPGETDAAFDNTYQLLDSLPVSYLHVFQFSPRRGTPAASMSHPVEKSVAQERSRRLRELGERKLQQFLAANIGQTHSVIFEESDEQGAVGLSSNYLRIRCEGAEADEAAEVLATGTEGDLLTGIRITRSMLSTKCG